MHADKRAYYQVRKLIGVHLGPSAFHLLSALSVVSAGF